MHFKAKQFVHFVLVSCLITPLQAFDTEQVQKLDINCFAQDEKSYLMDKSKSEFFSGLNAGEKYKKIQDGSIEKHFAETFDEVNALKKEDSESNFFTGMSMQERFQKLYDGSFEKHYSKLHDLRKKESYLQNSNLGSNNSINCQNSSPSTDLKGISASEKIQSIREGTFEKKVLGE